jgi:hypothetical protein
VFWAGNIEIHSSSSDWFKHGHHTNPAYDSVILHIATNIDSEVHRSNGDTIPQLQLECPAHVKENYRVLLNTFHYPPCYKVIPSLSSFSIHSWMSALQFERFQQKAEQVSERLKFCNNHWEDAFFITLARNFGFGVNSDAFETMAKHLPLRAVDKHRDNLFQVEAMFFGQAGLLQEISGDDYYMALKKEYEYLAHKFELKPMDAMLWRFLRLRPSNFPHIRIAQLAYLYHRNYGLLSQLMEKETIEEIRELLKGGTSGGGQDIIGVALSKTHPNFSVGKISIAINAVIYGICFLLFDIQTVVYSMIYAVVNALALDYQHTQNINVQVMIFTKKEGITDKVIHELRRGLTYWQGSGGYTDEDTYVLTTMVTKYELPRLIEIVRSVDPNAFVMSNEGTKIYGNFQKRFTE